MRSHNTLHYSFYRHSIIFVFNSGESINQRAADKLYSTILAQSEDAAWTEILQLERSFRGEHALTVLHVWMVLYRLRNEDEKGRQLSQVLYDSFQDDLEQRIRAEGLRVGINIWLKKMEQTFYGNSVWKIYIYFHTPNLKLKLACFMYFSKSQLSNHGNQGQLAEALYRNIFQSQGEQDRSILLERYVRRELNCLGLTDAIALFQGRIRFSALF
ncbi:ubiquinol cytochrome c reductase [Micromonas pusilla CCMP1545]|uniref:Ubiquinol cytochrome c reductase n=1 Tax=Micromonas pusilla (strain CCMP1545) TaxID=564608 RepID=C1MLD4_MICPC|nr:ubiquinol cytochrome c reductase [Micromonas pusilla CCMP1545]EEH59921.1 ubiquinol cytochrome c reductase [Micromonas pusilla CCMP1545]|eukprot:XP_003056545.1 ubiquinol cytochrome c reductase [Micromonas pusilla CCMP1545]